jgi:hypothetical protein
MDELHGAFLEPPNAYRPQPFWLLNYYLDPELLRVQIAEMADKGVGGVVLHPRHGLQIPFMSPAWLEAIEVCLAELAKYGMEAWLYDEDNWPSGYFGGRLTRGYPEHRMRYLRVQQLRVGGGATYRAQLDPDDNTLIAALATQYELTAEGLPLPRGEPLDISRYLSAQGSFKWSAPPGDWLVVLFWECPVAERVTWLHGSYLDTLHPATVRQFLQAVYEPHVRFQNYFGSTIKGVFTDEPGLMIHDAYFSDEAMRGTVEAPRRKLPGLTLPWSRDFLPRFARLKGYDLRPHLLELVYEVGDWRKVRCDFFDAVTSWYVESYHQQLSAWCEEHGLAYTGHTLDDPLYQQVRTQGNQARVLEQMHRPGLDYLGHGVHAGRILAAKWAASVAHVQGRERVLCEAFGGSGHAHRLSDRRLDVNFLAAVGVNMIVPHAFYYTFVGLRKTDWPGCEFYHAPFWPWYRRWADYVGRLCVAASHGHHVSGLAMVSPVKTFWVNLVRGGELQHDLPQMRLFDELSDRLLRLHYDFDYLDEVHLERAQVGEGELRFEGSQETYRVVILPGLEVISRFAAEKLLQFFESGGHLIALLSLPIEADRRGEDERVAEIMTQIFGEGEAEQRERRSAAGGRAIFARSLPDLQEWLGQVLAQLLEPDVIVESQDPLAAEEVLCSHRTDGRVHLFLLTNRQKEQAVAGVLRGPRGLQGRVEEWDLETGSRQAWPARTESERLVIPLHLEGSQARLFVVDTHAPLEEVPATPPGEVVEEVELAEAWTFEPAGPNVLILDELSFVARDRALGERLGVTIPGQVNSYTATFTVQGRLGDVRLVLDDLVPDLPSHVGFLSGRRNVEILLNGHLLPAPRLSSWMDPYYLEIEVDDFLQPGENVLQVACLSLLEDMPRLFEPLYLIGNFEVQGKMLKPPRGVIAGLWNESGYPHYAGIAAYVQQVELADEWLAGTELVLELEEVHDCCRVVVNGQEVGIRLWPPWRVDISAAAQPGGNEIRVEVANSAANLYDKQARPSGLRGRSRLMVIRR